MSQSVIRISAESFESRRYDAGTPDLKSEQAYKVIEPNGKATYAWSPDGEGFYWYDTIDELRLQH